MSTSKPAFAKRPSPLWTSWQLLRHFGPGWAAYRLKYALLRKSGWVARKQQATSWNEASARLLQDACFANDEPFADRLLHDSPFFFRPDLGQRQRAKLCAFDSREANPSQEASSISRGNVSLFHAQRKQLDLPPSWHTNALTGEQTPRDKHWSLIGDFGHGDIKVIWDLNRFHFAFALARAYARTVDEQWPQLFWSLLEDWRDENPPYMGANWKCGQEIALRAMAWCFALFAMGGSPHTTPARVSRLAEMLAVSADRIAGNINYAISQKNNHPLSEAAGLLTIGTLLPQAEGADRWRRLGRNTLRKLARELIYDDGAFSQHSWNYHRVMLHDYVWAIRLAEVAGEPFDNGTVNRVNLAGEALYQMMDTETGGVPCYGQDDGSLILPLNNCSYFDYRPVVQAAATVTTGKQTLPEGPWNEDLLWLFDGWPPEESAHVERAKTFHSPVGGYIVLRTNEGLLSSRAANFRHRPAQADMLHVDVWWRGQNVAIDPGTFTYNGPPPWNNPLATAAYHNTVTVDGRDQMTRCSRFVWLPWLSSTSIGPFASRSGTLAFWQGEHDGYQNLSSPVRHRRAVLRLPEEHWLVIDRLDSGVPHSYRLHWLFADAPFAWSDDDSELVLQTAAGEYHVKLASLGCESRTSIVRGDETSPRGWRAKGYQNRLPAVSVATQAEARECEFWSVLGPSAVSLEPANDETQSATVTAANWQVEIDTAHGEDDALVTLVRQSGLCEDSLTISA